MRPTSSFSHGILGRILTIEGPREKIKSTLLVGKMVIWDQEQQTCSPGVLEPSLLLRLGALPSLPCWVPCYPSLSVLFPIVPSSSNNKITWVGTLGPVASLWYEQSQSPFQSLRKLGPPQSQACQFLPLGWESRSIETGNVHISPRDPVLRCFSKSMQLWPSGHKLQGTCGLNVHGPEPRDPFPPPRSGAGRVSQARCAHPQGHISALQPWILSCLHCMSCCPFLFFVFVCF